MNLRFVLLLSILFVATHCSDDTNSLYAEPVVQAYDTLELRYQQMGDLAFELVSNVSTDPELRMSRVTDLLERQPVVNIDFRKPVTTRKDIIDFVNYQKKVDAGIRNIFDQLNRIPKWQSAPLIQGYRIRYNTLKDSIGMATLHFNSVVKDANLALTIPEKVIAGQR